MRGHYGNEKADAETKSNVLHLLSPCTFPVMTIITDKTSRQILPVAYKRKKKIDETWSEN